MNALLTLNDLLLCPATIVSAYPVSEWYVKERDGYTFSNNVEWLPIVITLTSSPAISLPYGFTADERPVGLQIVGRPTRRLSTRCGPF